jgi:hypothetical protein
MSVLALAGKTALSFVLPWLVSLAAGKALSGVNTSTPNLPKNAVPTKYPNYYHMMNDNGNMGRKFYPTPDLTTGQKVGGAVKGGLNFLGNAGFAILPQVLGAGGRLANAAGQTAGALAQAAGNVPAHLASTVPQSKVDRYGGTPMQALGGISSDLGTAANVGATAAGEAVGGTLNDMANAIKLYNLQRMLMGGVGGLVQNIKSAGGNPSQNQLAQNVITSMTKAKI